MKKKSLRKRHRIKKKKAVTGNIFFVSSLFFITIFLAAFCFLAFYPLFQVEEILVDGGAEINNNQIKNFIEHKAERKAPFLSSKSTFFFSVRKTEEEILKKAPSVGGVHINREFPNKLKVLIRERKPIAFWCREKDKDQCFFIDSEGVAFQKTEKISTERPIIVSRKELDERRQILKKEELSRFFLIFDHLLQEDIASIFFYMDEYGEITAHTDQGIEIYFTLENVQRELDNMKIILKEKLSREEVEDLEYIDLRFGDRVYYK